MKKLKIIFSPPRNLIVDGEIFVPFELHKTTSCLRPSFNNISYLKIFASKMIKKTYFLDGSPMYLEVKLSDMNFVNRTDASLFTSYPIAPFGWISIDASRLFTELSRRFIDLKAVSIQQSKKFPTFSDLSVDEFASNGKIPNGLIDNINYLPHIYCFYFR